MKILAALVVLLAIAGTAMAWNVNDQLQYTYTKTGYQQAGSDILLPQFAKAESHANFVNPGEYGTSFGALENEMESITVDSVIFQPQADLTNADLRAYLTQGGSATMATHSLDAEDNAIPEIQGTATAYSNLLLSKGFDQVSASMESSAMVGTVGLNPADPTDPTNNWVVTETIDPTVMSVDAETHGAGEFIEANLGQQVTADIEQQWKGSGWDEPTYSGGITMWAQFMGAHDPHCSNPIISTVSGSAATALFPSDPTKMPAGLGVGDIFYWGPNAYLPDGEDGPIVNPEIIPGQLTGASGTDGMFDIPGSEGVNDDFTFDP